jgi:hypothetical protein
LLGGVRWSVFACGISILPRLGASSGRVSSRVRLRVLPPDCVALVLCPGGRGLLGGLLLPGGLRRLAGLGVPACLLAQAGVLQRGQGADAQGDASREFEGER